MDYSLFNQLEDDVDQKINHFSQVTFSVRYEYDCIALELLKRCEDNSFELETSFPHLVNCDFVLLQSSRLYIDDQSGIIEILLNTGELINFSDLMIDVKDMFINHIHIHAKTSSIYTNFFSS